MDINSDNLSKLPHEIVILIITFLPFVEAFRLCLLRKEWHYAHLWLHCSSFELSETSFMCTPRRKRLLNIGKRIQSAELKQCGKLKFIDVFNWSFTNLVSPVLSKFSFNMYYEYQYQQYIDKWIQIALSKNVEELNLDFSDADPIEDQSQPMLTSIQYPLPEILYQNGRSIRVFSLDSCSLGSCNFESFLRLKSLSLTRVGVFMGEIIHIVTSCPLLETLSLVECHQLIKVHICLSMVGLKRLIVRQCEFLSLGVEICLPRLEYFEYTGSLVRLKFTQLDCLERVVFNFPSDAVFPYQSQEIREFFSGIAHIRILTICCWALKVFPYEYLYGSRPLFQSTNIEHLRLMAFMEPHEIPGILCLLKCSPLLKTLSILLGIRHTNEFLHDDYPPLPDALWTPTGWDLSHLQKVKIDGFTGKNYEFDLLKFIVRYSKMPLEVVIKPLTIGSSSVYSQTFVDLQNMENVVGRVVIRWC